MLLTKLFFTFFKIGAFTFGGGYAMLPLIQAEVSKIRYLLLILVRAFHVRLLTSHQV